MNKIYKIIWSEVRKCYVVVAEIAKNRGKSNVRTIVDCLAAHTLARSGRFVMPVAAAGLLLLPMTGWATEIIPANVLPDNQKNTIVNNTSGVYDVYTQRVISNTLGVNQFDKFSLSSGNIANMHFQTKPIQGVTPQKADSLVNLVKARIDVQGTVNAIKDGSIGGNLFFISPNGMTVGPAGVINTGHFVAMATSQGYFDELWSSDFSNNKVGNHDSDLHDAVTKDFANFGIRYKAGEQEGKEEGEFKSTNLDFNSDAADKKGIAISGRINARSGIGHDSSLGDFCNICPGVSLSGHTVLGKSVTMGTNSCTAPGVRIGDGASVACGTPVYSDLAAGETLSPFGVLKK